MAKQSLFDILTSQVEDTLWLETGTISELMLEQADWAFLVKTQVVIEALLVKALCEVLERQELEDVFGGQKVNAGALVDMAQAIEIITTREAAICRMLASIRNNFAHRIRYLNKTLVDWGNDISTERLAEVINLLEERVGERKFHHDRHRIELKDKAGELRDLLGQQVYQVLVTLALAGYQGGRRATLSREAIAASGQMPSLIHRIVRNGLPPQKPSPPGGQ
ncbi:hypothetical protein ACS5PK_11395 [Roseateles sp. DB2]|uniref:hypothetical protein n=1 Tax=Roseateles sp. DB2 TaxID=3453717 RepID=UPI003EE86755